MINTIGNVSLKVFVKSFFQKIRENPLKKLKMLNVLKMKKYLKITVELKFTTLKCYIAL